MTGGIRTRAAAAAALLAAIVMAAGTASAAEGYDQGIRDEFMRNCISGGGTYTVCQCTMQRIESAIAFEQFVTLHKAAQGGEKADQEVLDTWDKIVADCVAVKKE